MSDNKEREALLAELDWCIERGFSGPRSLETLTKARAALADHSEQARHMVTGAAAGAMTDALAQIGAILGPGDCSLPTLLACIRNIKHFAGCLDAVEREFFMVPGEPDEDFPDAEPENECLLNRWGSTVEQYVEQFRAAIPHLLAAQPAADAREAERQQMDSLFKRQPDESVEQHQERFKVGVDKLQAAEPAPADRQGVALLDDELDLGQLLEDAKRPHAMFSAGIVIRLIARIRASSSRAKVERDAERYQWMLAHLDTHRLWQRKGAWFCLPNNATEGPGYSTADAAIDAAEAPIGDRPCTCHPNDEPPVPCAKKYALSECKENK